MLSDFIKPTVFLESDHTKSCPRPREGGRPPPEPQPAAPADSPVHGGQRDEQHLLLPALPPHPGRQRHSGARAGDGRSGPTGPGWSVSSAQGVLHGGREGR